MDTWSRCSNSGVFLRKGVLRRCIKFTGAHPCISLISTKLLCNFIETALWHGNSPVNLLHIFRIPLRKNTSGRVLLTVMRAATKRNRFFKGISKKIYKYQRDLIARKYKILSPDPNLDKENSKLWSAFDKARENPFLTTCVAIRDYCRLNKSWTIRVKHLHSWIAYGSRDFGIGVAKC